jgi:hypothetical protein
MAETNGNGHKSAKTKARSKSKAAHRSAKSRPPEKEHNLGTREVVVTLSTANGNVVKIEKLEKSGQRHQVSDEELAVLIGEDEMDDLGSVLEEAYVAGIGDAIGEAPAEEAADEESEEGEADEVFGDFMFRLLARHHLVRRGIRRLVLRRVLGREPPQRERPQPKAKPRHARH